LTPNFLNPKIKLGQITLTTNNNTIIFSYLLDEKHTTELNIAAGKIHRNLPKHHCNIEGTKLTITLPKAELKNISFEEIKNLFEEIIN
jgi:hypothetical protein